MSVQHTYSKHHTVFDRIPIRGNFSFDPANPYLAYGAGLYVKVGRRQFARIAPTLHRGQGPHTRSTGTVQYYQNPKYSIDSVKRRVIQPNPDFVHQEQDMVSW